MMLETLFDGSNVNLWIAFAAGFVTFFASCLLPLVPTYLAYLSGVAINSRDIGANELGGGVGGGSSSEVKGGAINNGSRGTANKEKWQVMKVALFFVLGFIATFVLLSLVINTFSVVFASMREVIEIAGGFIFIIMGLFMLGVFKHRIFSQERRLDLGKIFSEKGIFGKLRIFVGALTGRPAVKEVGGFDINEFFSKYKNLHALITGVVFGFAWTPCIGPVLAVILFWSAQAGSVFDGVMLLIVYGIGLGVPFLIVAAGFEKILPILKKYGKVSQYVSYLSGVVIILAGILMMSGHFQELGFRIIDLFGLRKLAV